MQDSTVPDSIDVSVEQDAELTSWVHNRIIIPITTYERFMKMGKNWDDAFILYTHLYYTARCQKTNRVWANRTYLKKGLGWSQARIEKATKFLLENELIEITGQEKTEKGCFGKTFITVKYIEKPTVDRNPLTGKPLTETGQLNALSNKENAYSNKQQGTVVSSFASVKKQYIDSELAFTDAKIQEHIEAYGIDHIRGALDDFNRVDQDTIHGTVEAYFIGILKNYHPSERVEKETAPKEPLSPKEEKLCRIDREIEQLRHKRYNATIGEDQDKGIDIDEIDEKIRTLMAKREETAPGIERIKSMVSDTVVSLSA